MLTAFWSETRAPPTHMAPSLKRPMLRMLKAMMCPLPISPSRFSTGTWQSVRIRGHVEDPRMPILCSSAPIEKPGKVFSTRKAVNFVAIDFREDGEQVGEAGVGDPHFLAVQDVVLAIGGERGAGAAVERVGSGRGFRESVGADDFSGGQARQVFFLLLLGAEINDGKSADAGVSAPGGGEARVFRDVVGDDGGGDFVHFEAAVGFRDLGGAQAEFSGFLQQVARDGEVFVFDLLDVGENLVDREFFGGLAR